MASLYDITKGEDVELYRILSQAGADAELARAIIKRPELAATMIGAVREQLAPPLFSTPQEVLGRFAFYAGNRGWPLTNFLNPLKEQMPTDYVSSLNKVLTLDVWLGNLSITFEALAGWIEYEQRQAGNGYWRYDGLKSDGKHLRLLDPERYGIEPSVRWVEVDMLANWDKANALRPRDVRDPKTSAGLEIMTAYAVHPAYPPAIDYETIPGAWLPGLQVTLPGGEAWASVPLLGWGGADREVFLDASRDDDRYWYYALPVRREL